MEGEGEEKTPAQNCKRKIYGIKPNIWIIHSHIWNSVQVYVCMWEREIEDKQKQCKEEEKRAAIQTVNYLTKAANERKLNTKQEARNSIKHTAKI